MLYFLDEVNKENISYSDIFDEDDLERIRKLDYYKKAFVDIDEDISLKISVFKSYDAFFNKSNRKNLIQVEKSSNDDLNKDFKELFFNTIEYYENC